MLSNSAGHCHSPWTQCLFCREISYLILVFCFLILCLESMKVVKATNPDIVQALWGRKKNSILGFLKCLVFISVHHYFIVLFFKK